MSKFCPAPWMAMFIHGNEVSACCSMHGSHHGSPSEYLKSPFLKDLKSDFLSGKFPEACLSCRLTEEFGGTSIRNHFEANYPHLMNKDDYTEDTMLEYEYAEIRASNLCNFSCRMCNSWNSSVIEEEIKNNPNLVEVENRWKLVENKNITDDNWESLLKEALTFKRITLTGGEPTLIKKYYDLLEYLIEKKLHNEIRIDIYTNASTYNPIFVKNLIGFKSVVVNFSIDAVGKFAEYQRNGTNWKVVSSNIEKWITENPHIRFQFHSTFTAYNILDVLSLTRYFLQLENKVYSFKAHTVKGPGWICPHVLNKELRMKALRQLEDSVKLLKGRNKFRAWNRELLALVNILKNPKNMKSSNFKSFIEKTIMLDKIRQQSFQDLLRAM